MKVKVQLFATLRDFLLMGAETHVDLDLPPGSAVKDAIAKVAIPPEIKLLLFRNSQHVNPEDSLKDGDVIAVFPPIAGG